MSRSLSPLGAIQMGLRVLPAGFQCLRYSIRPNHSVATLVDVCLPDLVACGVRAAFLDVDGTILRKGEALSAAHTAWVAAATRAELRVVLVSNASASHVRAVGKALRVPWVARAWKPLSAGFGSAFAMTQSRPADTVVIGNSRLFDILGGNAQGCRTILVTNC